MKKITQFINETHPHLSRLITGKDAMRKIKNSLEKMDLFATHPKEFSMMKFSQGIVYLNVTTAAFATKIRHSTSMILQNLKNNMPELEFNAIQCKVNTINVIPMKETVYQKNKPTRITEKTKMKLSRLSEKINSKELKSALKKLVN